MTRRMAGGVARIVAGGKRRCEGSGLGDQSLSLGGVAVEIEELFQAINRRLGAAFNRADDTLGEVLNLINRTTQLLHRSGGAQDVER